MSAMRASLLVTLFLAGCVSTAPTDAPRGARAVIVQTDLSTEEVFREVGRLISERGYPIENSDVNIGSISTGFYSPGRSPVMVRLNVTVSGDPATVRFSGDLKTSRSDQYSRYIEASGMSGSPLRQAWAELEAVAALMGRPVSYQ